LESIEKAIIGFGARFDGLTNSVRVVERKVQGLLAHKCEQTEMCSEMRTSLTELSKNNDKITEVYRKLPEVALMAEAKQTRVQLRQWFEQLDALETRAKDMKASAETHSMTFGDIRRAVRKEQKDCDEWCSLPRRAIQNVEASCADIRCQLPVLAKNKNEHGKWFLPEMSSSAARLSLDDVRIVVNDACPTLPGRCERRIANSIAANLETILSHPLLGAAGGSTPRYNLIN